MKGYPMLFFIFVLLVGIAAEDCKEKDTDGNVRMAMTDDYFSAMIRPYLVREFRPWRYIAAPNDLESTVKTNDDKFEFNIDVQYYAPSEIAVRIDHGFVVVEAKHEEKKDDHGYVSRHLMRRYSIPDGVEPEDVIAQLSSDGVLTVSAPRKSGQIDRLVPIVPTGPQRKENKEKIETCDTENCSVEI